MNFFEGLLLLLLAAVILLQIARRLRVPYPSMLAMAGVLIALIPGTPSFTFDPHIALALFIAPALMDAAFDFPFGIARRFWAPLVVFAVGGVLVTAALVALAGWAFGLPLAAAIVLGAIVAPPDAAASTAILSSMAIPRRTDTVLRGESLFNDAAALLIFGAALAVQSAGGVDASVALHLTAAVPGGILLGVAAAYVMGWLNRYVADTLGGNLLQFVQTFLLWIIAERLELSAVLAVVSCAMTIAGRSTIRTSARMRVQSYAVWTAVVFVLNVVAFLMMGMQARGIVADMTGARLQEAISFAALVVLIVIAARFAVCIGFNRVNAYVARRRGLPEPATFRQAILASWCGMRGLVTLATAFALPASFPERDIVVLAAFAVVLATLVIQGLTLSYLVRWLDLDLSDKGISELTVLRGKLASVALSKLDGFEHSEAELLRSVFRLERLAIDDPGHTHPIEKYRKLALKAVMAQRELLEELRAENRVNIDEYNLLLEEIDWRELSVLPAEARRIEETS